MMRAGGRRNRLRRAGTGEAAAARPGVEPCAPRAHLAGMQDERQTSHPVEILPPDRAGRGAGGDGQSFAGTSVQPLSPFLRTLVMIAAIAAGFGLLALLVMFAATVALIAVPAALVAGFGVWLGMRWRAWRSGG